MKFTLVALVALSVGVNAATIISLDGSANDRTTTSGLSGQTFLFSGTDVVLDSISIQGPSDSASSNSFSLEIWTNSGGTNGFTLGSYVGTSTNANALSVNGASQMWNFTGVTLIDTQSYAFLYTDGTGNGADGIGANVQTRVGFNRINSTTSSYTEGEAIHNGGLFGGNWDVAATVNTSAVPEPSSTALLGLGGLALILRRRK